MQPRTTVVWVHGMGDTRARYSGVLREAFLAALPEHLREEPDIVAIRHAEIFYENINDQIAEKIQVVDAKLGAIIGSIPLPVAGDLSTLEPAITDAFGDVFSLWLSAGARDWVLRQMTLQMLEILQSARDEGVPAGRHRLHIICHSLGTFVTYEFLHFAKNARGIDVYDLAFSNVFMFAPVMALMKSLKAGRIFHGFDLAIAHPLDKPRVIDVATGTPITNVRKLWAYRHVFDPFASLIPVTGPFLDHEPFTFDDFHSGPNMHAFTNYVREFAVPVAERIVGRRLV